MAVHTGRHFQQLPRESHEFVHYDKIFDGTLERLYVIDYTGPMSEVKADEWKWNLYHGVGNCDCLEKRNKGGPRNDYSKVSSHSWCDLENCPIQKILANGFLPKSLYSFCHFTFANPRLAIEHGMTKCRKRTLSAIFICKVRDLQSGRATDEDVQRDKEIHPLYFAVVRA